MLNDVRPDEQKQLLEFKAKKRTAPAAPANNSQAGQDTAMTDAGAVGLGAGGALAAAGVLNAVDEDDDGEEAPVPDAFDVDEEEE